MKQDEYSTANQLLNAGATEIQQVNPDGPDKLNWKLYAGAIITSEARPTGLQLKRSAKLLTLIGLTTKHAACLLATCCIRFFCNRW